MAVVFMDGFDHYALHQATTGHTEGTANLLASKGWNNGNAIANWEIHELLASGPGRGIGNKNNGAYIYHPVAAAVTYTIGFAFRPLTAFAANIIAGFFTAANGNLCDIRADASGHILVTRNGTTLATSTNTMTLGAWHYIEFKATINSSTGAYEVRVDGSATNWIPAATGANTGSGNIENVRLQAGASQAHFDHFYVCDTSGSTNTTFLGPCSIAALRPAAPGNYAQWTGNGGANFANANELPTPDGDTSFNQSSTADQIDSHIFEDIPASSGSVFAIQHAIYAKRDAGGARTLVAHQRSSSTDYASSTSQSVGTDYAYHLDVQETDPSTSAAWTVAGVNGAEFGVKLTS